MHWILWIVALGVNLLYWLLWPYFWLKQKIQKRQSVVTHLLDPLLKISACELAAKIRAREISSEAVCRAYIKRIKEVNPIINAVVENRFESALVEAKNVDVYLRTATMATAAAATATATAAAAVSSAESSAMAQMIEKSQPLLGVPFTAKESCSVAGMSYSVGSISRVGTIAVSDGKAVSQLRDSGAIPLLVSNTPELCLSWETSNLVTGRTRNPYDCTRTSSGSSGGEGALLGSSASLVGLGSDIAGSIRLPAMFNGVFGHKPSPGIISIDGHYPHCRDKNLRNYLVIGPMTRYACDLKLLLRIMCEKDELESLALDREADLRKLNVYYLEKHFSSVVLPKISQDIEQIIRTAVQYLRKEHKSNISSDLRIPDFENICELSGSVLFSINDIPNLLQPNCSLIRVLYEILKSAMGISNISTNLLLFYMYQKIYSWLPVNDFIERHARLKQLVTEKLGDTGVLLYPTFPCGSFHHNRLLFWSFGISHLMWVNTFGLPATHIPCGFDRNGLPIGIQVIAGPKQDRLCLAVAEALERCFGGWQATSLSNNI